MEEEGPGQNLSSAGVRRRLPLCSAGDDASMLATVTIHHGAWKETLMNTRRTLTLLVISGMALVDTAGAASAARPHSLTIAPAGVAPPSAHASTAGLVCGDTVTTSVRLTADLTGCGDVGLRVGADDVTIDLQGHTIAGATTGDAAFGVLVNGHHGVSVTGGTVTGFTIGVLYVSATGGHVTGMSVHGNRDKGVVLFDASDNTVVHNRIDHNDDAAVGVFNGSDRNTVSNNTIQANGPQGVEILFSNGTQVSHNLITDTGSGVILESSDDTSITGNQILHSIATACDGCGIGIQIYGNRNVAAGNTILDAPRYGVEVDDFMDAGHSPAADNVIRGNVITRAGEGIAIGPEAGGVVLRTLIADNRVSNAADDGIQLIGPSTGLQTSTLTRNVTVHNGNWGIETVPGTIDGGGNTAAANGNPAQCLNITCR